MDVRTNEFESTLLSQSLAIGTATVLTELQNIMHTFSTRTLMVETKQVSEASLFISVFLQIIGLALPHAVKVAFNPKDNFYVVTCLLTI
jgi:hypothetical protein